VNIHRHPLGGRHFECYSEDPYLTARMAVAFIQGVQSQKVGTCIKHFVCNDSEFERMSISSEVGERALREIYLTPFVKSTVPAANAGLDLEMPGPPRFMDEKLVQAVKDGLVSEEVIDDKVRRILRIIMKSGAFEHPEEVPETSVDKPEHRHLAREAAAEAIVLLKNERNVLPLNVDEIKSLAVIGPNANVARIQGGGSARVNPHYAITPLDGILRRCFWFGEFSPQVNPDEFSARWTGKFTAPESGTYTFGLTSAGLSRLYEKLAAESDVALVFVGLSDEWESESFDRADMELPGRQVELIEKVAAANKNTVVVLNTGSPVTMTGWIDKVAAVIEAWYPGQDADILFGDVNPSGRLPTTFPKRLEDTPAYINYPGENGQVLYGEGLFVGYRYYDKKKIEPLFPFGHGLSYTSSRVRTGR